MEFDGHPVWTVWPEDLILSKLVWSQDSRSELQLRDVRRIIALQPLLDWACCSAGPRSWTSPVGCTSCVHDRHPSRVDAAFTAMFATLTPTQRLRMMSEMFDTARRMLVSNIRAMDPEISVVELRVQVCLRTYHDDYTPGERDRIVAYIRQRG